MPADSLRAPQFKRVVLIVLDGVGIGAAPDADRYGDQQAQTLGHVIEAYPRLTQRALQIPQLMQLGLAQLLPPMLDRSEVGTLRNALSVNPEHVPLEGQAFCGSSAFLSVGKDTTTGHWEMMGLITREPLPVFPQGIPPEILEPWLNENQLTRVLGNRAASGTQIIEELGQESLQTGIPILYTSGDSVWQIAAHESWGLSRLYALCENARKRCDDLGVGRVIARPFVGDPSQGVPFKRTYHRRDYSLAPPNPTVLDRLVDGGVEVHAVGKISDIFSGRGITTSHPTQGNVDGMNRLQSLLESRSEGLFFCNLIDFDSLYGHRRNPLGFGAALEAFDSSLTELMTLLTPEDLLLVSADHGNDPVHPGTDHTREWVPILGFRAGTSRPLYTLGKRLSLGDIGISVLEALSGTRLDEPPLQSFLDCVVDASPRG